MAANFEIALFTLANFLPCLALEIFGFRRSLRFRWAWMGLLLGLLCGFQVCLGLFAAPKLSPGFFSCMSMALGGLFFVLTARDQLGKKLFMHFMIANDTNLAVTATECILAFFLPDQAARPYSWAYSAILLGMQLGILSPMFFYVRKVYAQSQDQKRQFQAWNYLWLIPFTFYAIWFCLVRFGPENLGTQTHSLQFLLVTLMLCLGGIIVYGLVAQLIQEHVQNVELREREYRLSMQQAQYEHLQERIYEARKAHHDLRHHIHLASAYLNDGKLEELRTYLHKFSENIPDDTRISYCEHYAANALLSYFAWQAQSSGITCDISVDLPQDVGIPDEALTVVLGNLMENAIAACREERLMPEPKITVRGKRDETAVFFRIANTCTHRLRRDSNGQYLSAKSSGLGLSSVRDIAEQYEGMMEAVHSRGMFTVSIMLTIPEDEIL